MARLPDQRRQGDTLACRPAAANHADGYRGPDQHPHPLVSRHRHPIPAECALCHHHDPANRYPRYALPAAIDNPLPGHAGITHAACTALADYRINRQADQFDHLNPHGITAAIDNPVPDYQTNRRVDQFDHPNPHSITTAICNPVADYQTNRQADQCNQCNQCN